MLNLLVEQQLLLKERGLGSLSFDSRSSALDIAPRAPRATLRSFSDLSIEAPRIGIVTKVFLRLSALPLSKKVSDFYPNLL